MLLGCSAMYAVAFAGLLLTLRVPAGVPATVLAAAAVGAATPPSAPVTRAQWSALFSGDRLRTAHEAVMLTIPTSRGLAAGGAEVVHS